MQRTLKRELKVLEIVKREAIGTSVLSAAESVGRLSAGDRTTRGPWWPPSCERRAGVGRCTLVADGSASIGEVERWAGVRWAGTTTCLSLQTPALGIASARSRRLADVSTSGLRVGRTRRLANADGGDSVLCPLIGGCHRGAIASSLGMLTKWCQPTRLETRTKESNMYASIRVANPGCAMKVTTGGRRLRAPHHRPLWRFFDRCEWEHTCWDPKDSELCLHRVRPEEILVEARSDTDVQIVRQM